MKITTLDKTISDVLKEFYLIPRFQRPYSWERDQIEEFWNDTIVESESDYFIGAIVLFKQGERFGIVDGQQRITTILLMLCALRNAFAREKLEELAKGVQLLIERPDIDNKKQYVLKTETSHPFLQEHIFKFGTPELEKEVSIEDKLLADALNFFSEKFESTIESVKSNKSLNKKKMAEKIEETLVAIRAKALRLKLISVELDNEDDAYIIFETLNTRGKELETSHLAKNLFSRLLKPKNKDVDIAKTKWQELLATFEKSQVDLNVGTFLHHFWLSRFDYVTEIKLFKSMKSRITSADIAKQFLGDLIKDSRTYRTIYEPSYQKWKTEEANVQRALDALGVFKVRQPYPLLLSVLRAYRANEISKKNAESVTSAIESFHFMFTAVASKSSSGGLSKMYASLAQRLYRAADQKERQAVIKEAREKLRERLPERSEFETGFMQLRYSDEFTKQKKLVKYILSQIDKHGASSGIAADYAQMTIEHIAPQNPSGPTSVDSDHVAMLGNLVLCDRSLQDKLKNKSFEDKRKILEKSHISNIESIVSSTKWTHKEIEARTKELAKRAYDKIWCI